MELLKGERAEMAETFGCLIRWMSAKTVDTAQATLLLRRSRRARIYDVCRVGDFPRCPGQDSKER